VLLGLVAGLAIAELTLRTVFGLGHPLLYRSSPLFGYRLQPDQLVHRRGVDIRVNNLGLRAETDWDAGIENKILFLGNSVTFGGTHLPNRLLFSEQAVKGLPGFVAGNAGVNGWGVENIRALVVDYRFLPARTYVTVLQEMDFYRGMSRLAGKPFWTSPPAFAAEELLSVVWLDLLNGMYRDHDRFVSKAEMAATVERSCRSLKELDDFLRSRGYTHLLYISANVHHLVDGEPPDPIVDAALRRNGIHPIDIRSREELKDLDVAERQELFYDWNHLSEKGHALWGKIIGHDLEQELRSPAR
jgi:hypothetical protein